MGDDVRYEDELQEKLSTAMQTVEGFNIAEIRGMSKPVTVITKPVLEDLPERAVGKVIYEEEQLCALDLEVRSLFSPEACRASCTARPDCWGYYLSRTGRCVHMKEQPLMECSLKT